MTRFRSSIFALSALLAAACGQRGASVDENATPPEAPVAEAPATPEAAQPAAAASADFDVSTVPVSTVALGEFPYLSLPDGYVESLNRSPDFAIYPFWNGERFQMVEGRLSMIRIGYRSGKTFSQVELRRNIEHMVMAAGGVKIAEGQIPSEIAKALDKTLQQETYIGLGDYLNQPTTTFVIRQADKTIWVGLNLSTNGGGLAVMQAQPFVATAALLPADQLKQSLDRDGKVAIQVNFGVDSADILANSSGQIDKVVALLNRNPGLRLSVEGHTDGTGTFARNQVLSEARARAVVTAMTQRGIPADRLGSKGFGQSRPIADNTTEEGRARNRRVELVKL